MTEQPIPQQVTFKELNHFIINELLRGVSEESALKQLVKRGWPEVTARQFVANAVRQTHEYREKDQARKLQFFTNRARIRIIRGIIWIVAGLAILLMAGDVTSLSGLMAVFFAGAIVFGCMDLWAGLQGWRRTRK